MNGNDESSTTPSTAPTTAPTTAPSTTPPARLRGWGDAEQQMCLAIATLGELAGVDVSVGRGPRDMHPLLIEAAYQCNFNDPEFMDGPCCFGYVETVADIDILKVQADAVALGLAAYIRKRGVEALIREADAQLALMNEAFAWLRKARVEAKSWPMNGSAPIRRRKAPATDAER